MSTSTSKPTILIGTSGWSYEHWKESFYPKGLKAADWLPYFSSAFSTVEVNSTFYRIPSLSTVQKWYSQVPNNFTFSIKASKQITHKKKLHDCQENLDYFYTNIGELRSKLGPILFQLPPYFKADKELLVDFIKLLDKDYHYTFEFRHPSWFSRGLSGILWVRQTKSLERKNPEMEREGFYLLLL